MEEMKKKILIVEDDVFVREIYNTKFTKEGFDVSIAENGADAIRKMESNTPEIILLDLIMPYMDGMETLKKIKNNDEWKNIPVILLTNISEKEKVSEGLGLGANDYLIKAHFLPAEVVSKVRNLLGM